MPIRVTRCGILAVGLLEPAPAWVAADVEHGRQAVMGADRPHLQPDRIGECGVELGPERRRDADRLREHGGVAGHQAGADLLVDDRRDAQPGVFEEVPLELVGEGRRLAGGEAAGAAHASDVPDPVDEQRPVARAASKPVGVASWNTQALPSWASFSSIVIRASRSATRSAVDAEAIAVEGMLIVGSHGSFVGYSLTAPAVRPPTI